MAAPEHGSQAIFRALAVLKLFTAVRPHVTLTQICEETGLTMPTAHRITKALGANDFLTQWPGSSAYSLGPAVLSLAFVILQQHDDEGVVGGALPQMTQLRELTGETVGLHRMVGINRVCIAELASRKPIRMATGIGHSFPLAMSASGRALLTCLSRPALDEVLRRTKERHPDLSLAKVRRQLSESAARGYATTLTETVVDASALAAPIRTLDGTAIASLCITGPANRWTRDRIERFAPDLLEATQAVSRQLGHPTTA